LHVEVELGVDEQAGHLGQGAEGRRVGLVLFELGERQRADPEPELALPVPDPLAQDHAEAQRVVGAGGADDRAVGRVEAQPAARELIDSIGRPK
jgi:hypothetical protein